MSSSSFVCDITGEEVSGWDLGLEEAGMYSCQNGHTFSQGFVKTIDEMTVEEKREALIKYLGNDNSYKEELEIIHVLDVDRLKDYLDENEDLWEEYGYYRVDCPICQFKYGKPEEMLKYLLEMYRLKYSTVLGLMKDRFKDWKEFKEKVLNREDLDDLDYASENT